MKVLEVELGDELSTKRDAVQKFYGREVIVEHKNLGLLHGRIINTENIGSYTIRIPANRALALLHHKDKTLFYGSLEKLQVINPKPEDARRARLGHFEVTPEKISKIVQWARNYRT